MISDSEALNLLDYYHWVPVALKSGWVIVTAGGATDIQPSIREAVRAALKKQIDWALSA